VRKLFGPFFSPLSTVFIVVSHFILNFSKTGAQYPQGYFTSGPNNNIFSTFLGHPFKQWIPSRAKYLSFRSALSKLMWYRLQIFMGCSCQCHLPCQYLCTSMPSMCQLVCWRFICYHMCILRLQPSLHLSTLRFWTERKLVLYLTFSFQPKIQVLNMYKIYSTKTSTIPWLFATMNMSITDFSHGFVLVSWWSVKNSCNYLKNVVPNSSKYGKKR